MMLLMCPVCKSALTFQQTPNKMWFCQNQHCYDQAKQGYVNLHVVQHKHSKNPGDTVEAVVARRRFLAQGHYAKLQQLLIEIVQGLSVDHAIDIGCGEGYYTQAMADVITHLVAVDIAKSAVQIAAKQDQQHKVTWVVATGAMLPILDGQVQLCSSLFSPLLKSEILRVLGSGGYLLVATPAAKHLYAMRQALFDDVILHQPEKIINQLQPEFQCIQQYMVQDDLCLNQQQLKDLIAMTPYAWKAKADRRNALEQQQQFELGAEFCVYLFQKQE